MKRPQKRLIEELSLYIQKIIKHLDSTDSRELRVLYTTNNYKYFFRRGIINNEIFINVYSMVWKYRGVIYPRHLKCIKNSDLKYYIQDFKNILLVINGK